MLTGTLSIKQIFFVSPKHYEVDLFGLAVLYLMASHDLKSIALHCFGFFSLMVNHNCNYIFPPGSAAWKGEMIILVHENNMMDFRNF